MEYNGSYLLGWVWGLKSFFPHMSLAGNVCGISFWIMLTFPFIFNIKLWYFSFARYEQNVGTVDIKTFRFCDW